MKYSTTQARLRALEDNGVAECFYCPRIVTIDPEQDPDVPMICDTCIEMDMEDTALELWAVA